MKLQSASRAEVKRMAIGCCICAGIEIVGFFLLDQFGIGHFSYRMIIGALGGTVIAIANFTLLCLMVQGAAGTEDKKLLRAKVQASYNLRLALQALWVVAAFLIPAINVVAAAVPLLFPTAVIYYLRSKGKLTQPSEVKIDEPQDLPDAPGPFEE